MVDKVTFEKTTFNGLPLKFEAGTMNYIGAIGLGYAIDYIEKTGIKQIENIESELLQYGTNKWQFYYGPLHIVLFPQYLSIC